ncbi:MAG: GNAT family N-acyltransferase [Vicinamibacterales bacterium]
MPAGEIGVGVAIGRPTRGRAPRHQSRVDPFTFSPKVETRRHARVSREAEAALADRTVISPGRDGLSVFWTTAEQSPTLIRLVGREREVAFRAIGEGTGHHVDLDSFDRRYLHLCAWNVHDGELVGGYRMRYVGDSRGLGRGSDPPDVPLYTQTLFDYDHALLDQLAPAMELGRAFVRAPYQKSYGPLMLLWRGIGRMAAGFPGVRHLFGAASISQAHSPAARALMLHYLRSRAFDPVRARLVCPRLPPSPGAMTLGDVPEDCRDVSTLRALDAAVTRLNPSGARVPVLLRQYLKLGARVLGFNVDALFHDAIDALVVVDLERMPASMRQRYLPADSASDWIDRQRRSA